MTDIAMDVFTEVKSKTTNDIKIDITSISTDVDSKTTNDTKIDITSISTNDTKVTGFTFEKYYITRIIFSACRSLPLPEYFEDRQEAADEAETCVLNFNKDVKNKLEKGYKVYGELKHNVTSSSLSLTLVKPHKDQTNDKIKNYKEYILIMYHYKDTFCENIDKYLQKGYLLVSDEYTEIRDPFDNVYCVHALVK